MLVRVGSLQTHDEFWINSDHVVSIRVDRATGTAVIKLSDGTTHNVKISLDSDTLETDFAKVLGGRLGQGLTSRTSPSEVQCKPDTHGMGKHLAAASIRPAVLDARTLTANPRTR